MNERCNTKRKNLTLRGSLSESTAYWDTIQKKMLYARFGVKEYWIVTPGEAVIEVYSLKNDEYSLTATYRKQHILESRVIAGLRIDLKENF